MSRQIQNVASVRFEINARPASATMRALEEEAKSLRDHMDDVNKQIAELGNVEPDNKTLLDYRHQLKELKSDLDDVNRTIKDYTRGVKAADELLKAAETGTIEKLSMKAIKSGANGLRKRIENIQPDTLSPEDQQAYRIIKQVIDEADNVVNKFKTDAAETIRILQQGGTVSEKAMRQARDGVKSLMESYEEGSKENREFAQQYEFLAAKVSEYADNMRRAKGDIVDHNDARRAAVRLTREGAEAAARERQTQEQVIAAQQQTIDQTRALRLEKEKEIEQTNAQLGTQMRLVDAAMTERRQMDDDYRDSLGAIARENREQAQQRAQTAHDEADRMRANAQLAEQTAQQKRTAYEQETQAVNRLDGEVKKLTEDIKAMSAEPVKPKVDTSEIDALKAKLEGVSALRIKKSEQLERRRGEVRYDGDVDTWERILGEVQGDKNGKLRSMWIGETKKQFDDVLDVANRFYNIIKRIGVDLGEGQYSVEATEPIKKLAEQYKITEEEARRLIRTLVESGEVQKKFAFSFDERFGLNQVNIQRRKDMAKDGFGYSDKTDQQIRIESAQAHLKQAQNWEQHQLEVVGKLEKEVNDLYKQEADLKAQVTKVTEQSTQATDAETESVKKQEQEVARLTKAYEKAADEMGEIEEAWNNKIMDYVGEHYPTQATVSAKTKSPEGLKEREAMKKDPVLAQMQEQMKQEVGDADDRMMDVLGKLSIEEEKLRDIRERSNQTLQQSTQASKESATTSDELQRKQTELAAKTDELAQAKQRQAKAQGEMNTAEQQAAKAQDDANQKQVEAIQLGEKAAQANDEAAKAEESHNAVLQRQDEKIAKLQNDYDALDDTLRKQEGELAAYDETITKSEQNIAEAERKKAQARELSAKDMRDAIAALRERNDAIGEANPEWEKNERLIAQYNQRLEEMKQRSAELRGEVMSLSDALGMAGTIDGGGVSVEKMEQAIKTLTEAKRKATDQKDFDEYGAAIDKISQKLKEATSEWMSLSRAEEIARQAGENYYLSEGKSGFVASPEEIQKATQALERQRETLIKTIQTKKASGEATEAEERKLADLTKKLRDLKFEEDNVNMSQEKMRRLMEQPAQAVSLDELRAAIKRADGELRRMEGSLGKNSKEYKAFAEQVKQAKNTLKDMEGAAKASASAWEKAWSRLKTYVGLYMGFNIMWQKMTGAANDLLTLSDKMGEVRKTTQMTADEVGRLSDALTKLDTRTSLTGLMEFSSLAGSIGLKTQEDVQGFTEAANMLSVSLPELGNEASRTLMKIADATGDLEKNGNNVRETLERVGSTVIALRANSAAAAGPITDFVSRVGAVGAQAGISIDQIAALGATVDALGGRVEMSATALSRMIPAIRNNTFEVAQAIGMTEKQLKSMSGIDQMVAVFKALRDSVKNFDMTTEEGMNAAADAVENMLGRSASMQEVMKVLNQQGARAGIVFGLLSQNVDTLEEQLKTAGEAYKQNTALMDEYNKMNDTAAAKWERLKNTIEEMFVSDSMQRTLGGLIDALRKIVDLISGPLNTAFLSTLAVFTSIKLGLTEIPSKIGSVFNYLKESAEKASNALEQAANATSDMSKTANGVEKATGAIEEMTGATKVSIFSVKGLTAAWKGLNTTMKTNIILAAAAALYTLGKAVYNWLTHESAAEKAMAKVDTIVDQEVRKFERFNKTLSDSSAALKKATKEHDALAMQVKNTATWIAREKNKKDASIVSTKALSDETEKLKKKEDELKESEEKVAKASSDHKKAISEMNSIYGKYLNFILTEANYANLAAAAHDKVTAAIRRETLEKQKSAALDEIYGEHREDLEDTFKDLSKQLSKSGLSGEETAMAKQKLQSIMQGISYNPNNGKPILSSDVSNTMTAITGGKSWTKNKYIGENNAVIPAIIFNHYLQTELGVSEEDANKISGIQLHSKWNERTHKSNWVWGGKGNNSYMVEYLDFLKDQAEGEDFFKSSIAAASAEEEKKTIDLLKKSSNDLVDALAQIGNINYSGTKPNEETLNKVYDNLAVAVENIEKNIEEVSQQGNKELISQLKQRLDDVTAEADAQMLQAARNRINKIYGGDGGIVTPTTTNLYGDYNKVTSPYKEWNGNDLVARRKEMLERVKALANGADVQAVLSEDAKFISDAVRKNIKTTEQAIEWYNTERLKIQDALHAKHLTNTGDWMDPEKVRKRVGRVVNDEMKYYLDELDAYYTERKAKIQEAQNDQEISEAEARNRTLANDAEWQQRRAELQLLYSKRRGEVVQQEQDEIFRIISERTGETSEYIKADIAQTNHLIEETGKKNKAAMDRIYGDIELGAERSFLRQRNAIGQHMKDITAIVNKENPYAGITEELRKNLGTMDALLTDIENEEERTMDKEIERTMFILEQSTKGYSLTWEQLMVEMAKRGWQAWADAIDGDTQTQQRLMHQVYRVFEKVQDAIKKEASELKKQADIMWSNILLPGGDGKTTIKDAFEQAIGALGIQEGRVSRANSLIGAGVASERVADKLAIQQLKVQLAMQRYQYNLIHKIGQEKIDMLRKEAEADEANGKTEEARLKRMQAQNAEMALNLATRKEQTEEMKQQEEIIARTEESQNRLYTELKEWADLLTSSIQGVFEASHAGDAEYYNERAKLDLTGKGGPGAGTYVVIDDAGTSDARAHYEYLDERQALERQHEIERENAQAEAWKKLWDDINMKMSDQITDWINATLQNQAIDANTQATIKNTEALANATNAFNSQAGTDLGSSIANGIGQGLNGTTNTDGTGTGAQPGLTTEQVEEWKEALGDNPMLFWQEQSDLATEKMLANMDALKKGQQNAGKSMQQSAQTTFAKMTMAANMYGIAYQAMSNENLSTTQKFEMMALQAVGNYAISALTTEMAAASAKAATDSPGVLGTLWKQLGWAAAPVFAIFTGLLGGLMGLASSKISSAKSQIAQATGASVGAGRLATGMLTYAEGNVNEFTDPASLTPGRQYNVDGADGKTYRARYMGKDAKTHITNGPEFHLVGEKGREAIIDAHTTRLMQTDDTGIWQAIQTLYNGGRVSGFSTRRGRGVRAFAEGNLDDFEDAMGGYDIATDSTGGGMSMEMVASLQASIDQNNELLARALSEGIKAVNKWDGPDGIPNMYNKMQKEAQRHGVKYL